MLTYEEHYRYLTTKFVPEGSKPVSALAELLSETTIYEAKGKKFTFVGERHVSLDGDMERALRKIFDWAAPKSVLIEVPEETGIRRLMENPPPSPMFYTAKLAVERGVPVRGYDLSPSGIFGFFATKLGGDEFELALYWWIANAYRNCLAMHPEKNAVEAYDCARKGAIAALAPGKSLSEYAEKFEELCGNSGQDEAVGRIMAEITEKYVGNMQYLEALDTDVYAPYPFGKKEINKINARLEAYRNCLLAAEVLHDLGEYGSVLAAGGSGHVRELRSPLRDELESEFGECKVTRASDLMRFDGELPL